MNHDFAENMTARIRAFEIPLVGNEQVLEAPTPRGLPPILWTERGQPKVFIVNRQDNAVLVWLLRAWVIVDD